MLQNVFKCVKMTQKVKKFLEMFEKYSKCLKNFVPGLAVTICSKSGSFRFCLYWWSPKARDRFNPPFTRPSAKNNYSFYFFAIWKCHEHVRYPPAFLILVSSMSSSGLWSKDSATAFPALERTPRLSPMFAVMIFFVLCCKKNHNYETSYLNQGCKKTPPKVYLKKLDFNHPTHDNPKLFFTHHPTHVDGC